VSKPTIESKHAWPGAHWAHRETKAGKASHVNPPIHTRKMQKPRTAILSNQLQIPQR
jgi:hypothetical protein